MTRTLFLALWLFALGLAAQSRPGVAPAMTYVDADGFEQTETAYDGPAPLTVTFSANPENLGTWTPRYEWRFTRDAAETPFLVRYDETTQYTFAESGMFRVTLLVTFTDGTTSLEYEMDEPFTLTFAESRLEFPNAFSPNGDGVNDVLRAKDGYESIVEFRAAVFNRWGRKLHEWTDPADGWDGRASGSDAPDGAYYLTVDARGADGRKYRLRKTISLLRGYTEDGGALE